MKLLDLFSGIGGFPRGIEQAGIEIENHYYSEIDKYAKAIYRKHWPEAVDLGAVESIDGSRYEPFDLITFGFPCQDLSIAGKREGLSGARSNLFFEATRIIRENRPSAFIFENVKGLFSSNDGKDFVSVLREIADIGLYECQWSLVNSANYVPQNRERIYFVGCLAGGSGQQIFPIRESRKLLDKENKTEWISTGSGDSYAIDCGYGRGGAKRARTMLLVGNKFRRLTPTECERLQGFPDHHTELGLDENGKNIEISDNQRYRCLGNAVTTNVVQAIMKKWKNKSPRNQNARQAEI